MRGLQGGTRTQNSVRPTTALILCCTMSDTCVYSQLLEEVRFWGFQALGIASRSSGEEGEEDAMVA